MKGNRLILFFVVIAKVSYLLWVNDHQPHENTVIKRDREKLYVSLLCGVLINLYDYFLCLKYQLLITQQ